MMLSKQTKPENKRPYTATVRYEMEFFLGQFGMQHKAAYERDYLAIGVLKLYDMIIKTLA